MEKTDKDRETDLELVVRRSLVLRVVRIYFELGVISEEEYGRLRAQGEQAESRAVLDALLAEVSAC